MPIASGKCYYLKKGQYRRESLETCSMLKDEFEVEELNLQSIKCEVKREELHDEGEVCELYGRQHVIRGRVVETSLAKVDPLSSKCDIKTELLERESEHLSSNGCNQNSHKKIETCLPRIMCPGCPKFFFMNRCGLSSVSHHIMSCHRLKRRLFMHILRGKCAMLQVPEKYRTFRL